uniref:Lysophospholipid acyltransferase family protein n=1 Tax=Roseihalotalea indica TaxID=2867963 RepID=A0AA49GKC7_9BACT|nr:lysophospholipid acyltransferase family protein [Tunicatimonas sp. TK19036]
MGKVWLRLYSTYGLLVFGGVFLILFPLFSLALLNRKWHRYALLLNQFWSRAFLMGMGVPAKVYGREHLKKNQTYVLAPNHFSLLDIAVMGYIPKPFVFVGKVSLAKIPLFGFMFKKLHITVDRKSLKSRYQALQLAKQAADEGKSLVMYPEGGIQSEHPPQLARFKNGPFKVAIEKQIPVVPITIPFNFLILPDDDKLLMRPRRPVMIIHPPIETRGMVEADVNALREQTFAIIEQELQKYHQANPIPHEN